VSLLAQQMSHSSSGELLGPQLGGGAAVTGGISAADIRGMPDNPHKYLQTLVSGRGGPAAAPACRAGAAAHPTTLALQRAPLQAPGAPGGFWLPEAGLGTP
jgi:hypothetical protein